MEGDLYQKKYHELDVLKQQKFILLKKKEIYSLTIYRGQKSEIKVFMGP